MGYLIFDFFCPVCRFQTEAFVKDHSEDSPKCPVCESNMERLLCAPTWKWASGCRGF